MSSEQLGAFDVLNEISAAYWGKQMYFIETVDSKGNTIVYDRYNCEYITLEEAVGRFAELLSDDGSV